MLYRVILNDQNIYGESEDRILLEPKATLALNSAGSFDFIISPFHSNYDDIKPITSRIFLYEKDKLLWYGRPMDINFDFYNNKQIHCEGALSFFNDSIQNERKYSSLPAGDIFSSIIAIHNAYVDTSRQFIIGKVSIILSSKTVTLETDYNSTFSALSDLRSKVGGYLFVRYENGKNYIDWLDDLPETSSQEIRYSINLISLSQVMRMSELKTSIIPLGPKQDNEARLTIASVNGGNIYLDSPLVSEFGRIVVVCEFEEVTTAQELYDAAEEYINNLISNLINLTVNAADLAYLEEDVAAFRLGQYVRVRSEAHGIDTTLPITKLDIDLSVGGKELTIGTQQSEQISSGISVRNNRTFSVNSAVLPTGSGGVSSVVTYELSLDNGELVLTGSDNSSSRVALPTGSGAEGVTYAISLNGGKIKLTGSDNSTSEVTLPTDNNTTYAISIANGKVILTGSDGSSTNAVLPVASGGDAVTYTLSKANGKIKLTGSDGSNTEVDEYNLPQATAGVLGGVKLDVATLKTNENGQTYVDFPQASNSVLGCIKIDNNTIKIDDNGRAYVVNKSTDTYIAAASPTTGMKIGDLWLSTKNDSTFGDLSRYNGSAWVLVTNIKGIGTIQTHDITLSASAWSANPPYTQSVNIAGIKATDEPLIDIIYSTDDETYLKEQLEWRFVSYADTYGGRIAFTCKEYKPTIDLNLHVKVV